MAARARNPGAMDRVDVHFHLLPGVDDGPATMDESVALARAAVADGTRAVVTTPHIRQDFVTDVTGLAELVREVRAVLARERVPLQVELGGELGHRMVGRLSQEDLETIAVGPGSGRWLLLETPFAGIDEGFRDAAEELRERGFGLVLAHPERSVGGVNALRPEIARGALAQVNAASLAGDNGAAAQEAARRLVTGGMAALLASDAHSPRRPPALGRGVAFALRAGLAPAAAESLVGARPARLLARGLAPPLVAA